MSIQKRSLLIHEKTKLLARELRKDTTLMISVDLKTLLYASIFIIGLIILGNLLGENYFYAIFFFGLIILTFGFGNYSFNNIGTKRLANQLIRTVDQLLGKITEPTLNYRENIDEVIQLSQTLHDTIQELQVFMKKYQYSMDYKNRTKLTELVDSIVGLLSEILIDIQSDLSYRISEQKSTLEKAKSEVSQHVQGTTELNEISELQQSRLDRQIEQFEELQRVLVRV